MIRKLSLGPCANGLAIEKFTDAVCNERIVGFLALVTDEQQVFHIAIKDFQKAFDFFKGCMMGMAIKNSRVFSLYCGLYVRTIKC